MNSNSQFGPDESPSIVIQISDVCERFETEWRAGRDPRIEDYLESPGVDRRLLLWQLLQVEWDCLGLEEEKPDQEAYLKRFSSDRDVVVSAIQAHQGQIEETVDWSDRSTDRDSKEAATVAAVNGKVACYDLIRLLGRGAFGSVFLARDTQLDRDVALKIPRTGRDRNKVSLDRLMSEARVAAQLSHPNIVSVFEAGQADSVCFIATDFVQGPTLEQAMASGAFSRKQAVILVRTLAIALHHAHTKGIFHRDIKPANILIDEEGEPHIADFGLARWESRGDDEPGALLGTPAYMSPEQASGDSHQADARSDLWSLGVVLFELLSGRRPFQGRAGEVLEIIRSQDPPSLRQLRHDTPRDLEAICRKCLQREPDDRYASCQHLADDLYRWLEGRTVSCRQVGVIPRLGRWCRRQPVIAGMLTLTAALAAWGAFATVQGLRADVRTAQLERNHLLQEQERARQALRNALYQDASNAMLSGQWRVVLDKAQQAIDAGHDNQVELRLMLLRAYTNEYRPQEFRRELQTLAAIPDLGKHRGEVLLWQAEIAMLDGENDKAETLYAKASKAGLSPANKHYLHGLAAVTPAEAISHFKKVIEEDPNVLNAWGYLCIELTFLGKRREARELCNQARGRFPNAPAFAWVLGVLDACEGDQISAETHLTWLRQNSGQNLAAASDLANELIIYVRSVLDPESQPDILRMLTRLTALIQLRGGAMFNSGNSLRLPERLNQELLPVLQAAPGYLTGFDRKSMLTAVADVVETRPEASFLCFYAGMLFNQGKFAEAEKVYERAAAAPALFPESNRHAVLGLMTAAAMQAADSEDPADWDRAMEHAKRLQELGPLGEHATQLVFSIAVMRKDHLHARLLGTRLLEDNPGNLRMNRVMMVICDRMGSTADALDYADKVLAKSPMHKQALAYRARLERQLAALRQIAEEEPAGDGEEPPDGAKESILEKANSE